LDLRALAFVKLFTRHLQGLFFASPLIGNRFAENNPKKTTMKNLRKFPALALMALFLFGCARNRDEKAESVSVSLSHARQDSLDPAQERLTDAREKSGYDKATLSSSAAKVSKDTSRKFIRTADLKFRVRDVIRTTYRIEDIVAALDGFVTYTSLNSTINHRTFVPISRDSAMESTFYTVGNELVIRVPDTKLDTTLKSIAGLVDFLDSRIITAEDVSLNLLSEKLTEVRLKTEEERLKKAIDNQGRKLPQTTEAEDHLIDRQAQNDEARLHRLKLLDQISFSTIKISMYQRESVQREKVENEIPLPPYEPGFGHQVTESLTSGWMVLRDFVLVLLKIWWFWMTLLAGYMIYRKFRR
jgi:hypothetical protein